MNRIVMIGLFLILLLTWPEISFAEEDNVHVVVSKRNHQLTVFLNDASIYTFTVATGKTSDMTPEGAFHIIRKVKNPWYLPKNIRGGDPDNPIGTRWIGLNVPNTDGYKYGIHGTNDPESIGKNISQGCIRMKNEDIEWLFRHLPLETQVIIEP